MRIVQKNGRGFIVKWIRLTIIACILFALIVPLQATAQSSMYFDNVKGKVYNKAFAASGAKVTLYTYDGKKPGEVQGTITTGSDGTFTFRNVMFDPAKPVSYIVKAERDGNSAFALVLYYPPGAGADEPAEVQWINIDIASDVPAMRGDATVTVWSTVGTGLPVGENLARVLGASISLYSVDTTTGNLTPINFGSTPTTDSEGQYRFPALPYGKYFIRAEKSGKYGNQYFWVTQQENALNVISDIDVPKATPKPCPVPVPSSTPSGGFGLPIPGFEAILALIAFAGAIVLYMRRE